MQAHVTELNTSDEHIDDLIQSVPMYQAAILIWQIGIPILFVAGTFGNVMIILIHTRQPRGRDLSMPVFFVALAASDLLSLWYDPLFWWLEAVGVKMDESYIVLCKLRVFLAYTTGHTSAWILVAMTFQRAGSILWPQRVNFLCSRRFATTLMCFLFAFLAFANAHILYGHTFTMAINGTDGECFFTFVDQGYESFFNNVWGWVDTSMCSSIPFSLLLLSNTILVKTVGQSVQNARQRLVTGQANQLNSRVKKVSSMTVTLISISVEFLFLTGPVSVYHLFIDTFSRGADEDINVAAANELALSVSCILWSANNAINFYIYCLTGTRYRKEFLRLISFRKDNLLSNADQTQLSKTGVQKDDRISIGV